MHLSYSNEAKISQLHEEVQMGKPECEGDKPLKIILKKLGK